jgi:hypothetical protein
VTVQTLCLEVKAAVDLGEPLIHFLLQGFEALSELPLQAFLQIYDQSFEVIHDTLIVHLVCLACVV